MCSLELNPWPFPLLTQCSTTEPQEHNESLTLQLSSHDVSLQSSSVGNVYWRHMCMHAWCVCSLYCHCSGRNEVETETVSALQRQRDGEEQSKSETLTLSKESCPQRITVLMREQNHGWKGQISLCLCGGWGDKTVDCVYARAIRGHKAALWWTAAISCITFRQESTDGVVCCRCMR